MWGAPPPEQPRGARAGQSGRYPRRPGSPPPGASGSRWPAGPGGRGNSGRQYVPPAGGHGPASGARPAVRPGRSGPTYPTYGPYGGPAGYGAPEYDAPEYDAPEYDAPGYGPPGPPPGPWTSGRMPAAQTDQHHLRFTIFHDGNAGHLWRGELGSLLGEAVVSAGVVMWLGYLTYSPQVVALALVALGLPALLAGPLGATLTRVEEPAGLFKLVGRVRVVFALGLIGMHYLTVLPVLYLLLFGLSLCGRMRSALRVAAMRACLAPGEPERVAASTHFAAVIVAVVGPLLASLLYILAAQRILLVAIGGALMFFLCTSSDAMLDALPRTRRAFLLAQPEPEEDEGEESEDEEAFDEDLEDGEGEDDPEVALMRREAALPEWEQWGPGNMSQAIADVTAGLRLIGSSNVSTTALRALATLALVGGGLSVLEVFYITDHLFVPTYYLGALLAAEGAGLALGATLWSDLGRRGSGKGALLVGTVGTGAALAALAVVNQVPLAIAAAVGMGVANALAVEGGREALRAGFNGLARRAMAAAESTIVALCGLVGALIFYLFRQGLILPRLGARGAGPSLTRLQPFTVAQIFLGVGIGLVVGGIVFAVLLNTGGVLDRMHARRAARRAAKGRSGARGRIPGRGFEEDEESDSSGYYPAAGGVWDEGDEEDRDDEPDEYEDSRYARSYGAESRASWNEDEEPEDDDWDTRRRGGGGRPGPRTPPTRGGGRRGWR